MPPLTIDGVFPLSVTQLSASLNVSTPYIQQGPGASVLAVPNPAGDDVLVVLSGVQTMSSKTLLNPVIQLGTITSATINYPVMSASAISASSIADGSVSDTEYQFINSLTSNAQNQLNKKMTGTAAATSTMAAATASDAAVTPAYAQYHPSAAKAWVKVTQSATTILTAYNITSVQNVGKGDYDVCFSTPFSTTGYVCIGQAISGTGINYFAVAGKTNTVGTQKIAIMEGGNAASQDLAFAAVFYGTQ